VSNRGRVRRRTSLLVSLLIALFSARGDAGEASGSGPRLKACLLKTLSTETPVNQLSIHPDSHLVAYTFAGVIGRAGGFRAIDYSAGAALDVLPSRSPRYVDMKIAPSGRRLAFVQAEKGVSTLRIGALDGSNSEVCTSSSAYLRPLAFSADEQLLIAMSSRDNENRIILCRSSGGVIRSWPNTTMRERLRESVTPRWHGRPPWLVDSAFFSADAQQILSVRTDRQLVVWDIDGTRVSETALSQYSSGSSERRVAFAEDGKVLIFNYGTTDQPGKTPVIISSLFPEQKRAELVKESRVKAAPGTDHVYFYSTSQGLYLLLLKPSGVAIVRALSGETVAEIPVSEAVSALAMSGDGTMLGVATPGRVTLWRLVNDHDKCA
jgi:WD40 repeat protein